MVGVNIENLDMLIKKNNLYLNSFNSNSKKLIGVINEFNSCYSGNSLQYLFSEPMKERSNIENISSIIENYSNIMSKVKLSYQTQDQLLKTQVNRINPDLK